MASRGEVVCCSARRSALVLGVLAAMACSSRGGDDTIGGGGGSGGDGGNGSAGAMQGKCGDGKPDAGEQCDDGNTTPGDGCDAACQTECLGGAVRDPATGHCYALLAERRTFEEARVVCKGLGKDGDLAVFENAKELQALEVAQPSIAGLMRWTWVGARTTAQGPAWVSGAPWTLDAKGGSFWRDAEPDGGGAVGQYPACVGILNGLLSLPEVPGAVDLPCDMKNAAWCEFPVGVRLACGDGRVTAPEQCEPGPGCKPDCALDCLSDEVGSALTGSCYFFSSTPTPWATANSKCYTFHSGARLISVNETFEQRLMEGFLTVPDIWLGGKQTYPASGELAAGDGWTWQDGTAFTQTVWGAGEPNDWGDGLQGNKEDCLLSVLANGGGWNDAPCGDAHPYLCERKTAWVPP